jgi:hypothetical protein
MGGSMRLQWTKTLCATKSELLRSYSDVLRVYGDLVSGLHQKHEHLSREEYEELNVITEEWRAKAEEERLSLEQHRSTHGC